MIYRSIKGSYNIYSFIGLFFISIVIVYLLPAPFKLPFFFTLIILFFNSKNNAFWLAYFFVLGQSNSFLFFGNQNNTLTFLTLMDRQISFIEIIYFVMILKVAIKSSFVGNQFYSKWIIVLLLFSVWLLFNGFSLGMNLFKFLQTIRFLIPFALFFTIPALLKDLTDFKTFFYYTGNFIIIVLLVQVFEIIFRQQLHEFLGGTYGMNHERIFGRDIIRQVYAPFLILITSYGLINLKILGKTVFNISWLNIILAASFLSISISATRGYWLGISLILFFYLFRFYNARNLFQIIIIISLFFFLLNISPKLKTQIYGAKSRISTLELLLQGDFTAGRTLIRITKRQPKVINKYKEHPLLGFGFSKDFFKYQDVHVAHASILLNSGILGYLLWVLFWLFYIFYNFTLMRRKLISKDLSLINILSFIALLGIGSSSTTVFSYLMGGSAFYLAIFFSLSHYSIQFQIKDRFITLRA